MLTSSAPTALAEIYSVRAVASRFTRDLHSIDYWNGMEDTIHPSPCILLAFCFALDTAENPALRQWRYGHPEYLFRAFVLINIIF
jgi:hypothetical protein